MSLVEKALRKLQDARSSAAAAKKNAEPTPPVVGSVAESGIFPAPLQPTHSVPLRQRQSSKVINVDRVALRATGFLPPEQAERRLASEYRQIKRPLIAAALGKDVEKIAKGHLMMVASALPGEGKTFTSVNLALSMALEKDLTVLLVDADLAKPHISRTFGVQGEPGLVDALLDDSMDIESAVIPTDIEGLSILPAGRMVENATELLASGRMEQVVADLANADAQRMILFDSPPLLLTSESRVLVSVVGQSVIVVRAGITPRTAVMEALAFLGENAVVSLILNQSETETPAAYYGYGDYYGVQTQTTPQGKLK